MLSAPKEEYLAYYDQKNIAFSGNVSGFQASENQTLLSPLYQLRKQLLAVIGMGSDEQTLLRAILLGERTGLFEASFYHSIKVAGLGAPRGGIGSASRDRDRFRDASLEEAARAP